MGADIDSSAPIRSFSSYMMQVIMTLSDRCKISPFDILQKDFDDFALIVNYFLEERQETPVKKPMPKKENRIKVNDKTATGGWY